MPCELHTPEKGEAYVDWIAVLPRARGKGVGTKLMAWCEEVAMAKGATRMTLGVINGNPAIRLYERIGYVKQTQSGSDRCWTCLFMCLCFGRPYGCCHPEWGGMMMEKPMLHDEEGRSSVNLNHANI